MEYGPTLGDFAVKTSKAIDIATSLKKHFSAVENDCVQLLNMTLTNIDEGVFHLMVEKGDVIEIMKSNCEKGKIKEFIEKQLNRIISQLTQTATPVMVEWTFTPKYEHMYYQINDSDEYEKPVDIGILKGKKSDGKFVMQLKDTCKERKTDEFRQILNDFQIDLNKWITQTTEIVEQLNQLAVDLNEHFRNVNIAKVSGSAGAIVGGIMTVAGLALIPFTFGGSLALSIAGGAVAGAGGVTVGGSAAVNVALAKKRRETAESLLKTHSDLSTKIKDKCIEISQRLQKYGELESEFPHWVHFWAKTVKGTDDDDPDWNDIRKVMTSSIAPISSATARTTAQVGTAALRIAGAGAGVGLHVVGGVAGLLFAPLDIYTLVDSAIDIHKKNQHEVSKDIKTLADNLSTLCPAEKDVEKMIMYTLSNLKDVRCIVLTDAH